MPGDKSGGRVVFVGNIPYGLTEEQVVEIFSSAGQVLNFRLVHDRETGRPKGFGFAEFADPEVASSAVRNLDNFEVMNRKLRVDFSHEGGDDANNNDQSNSAPTNGTTTASIPLNAGSGSTTLPPLPPGTDLPPGVTCPDAISRTLNTLPPAQLLDILSQMKGLVTADPAKATELLRQAPQLSYAIFQALLLMGLVDASALQEVVETAAGGGQQPQQQGPPQDYHPPPPQPPQQQQQAAAQPFGQGMDQAALIQQVLNLTPAQIDALNEPERSQIQALRQQLMPGSQRAY